MSVSIRSSLAAPPGLEAPCVDPTRQVPPRAFTQEQEAFSCLHVSASPASVDIRVTGVSSGSEGFGSQGDGTSTRVRVNLLPVAQQQMRSRRVLGQRLKCPVVPSRRPRLLWSRPNREHTPISLVGWRQLKLLLSCRLLGWKITLPCVFVLLWIRMLMLYV